MPDSKFLETYPIYKRFEFEAPNKPNQIEAPPINMKCKLCNSNQTFRMTNKFDELYDIDNSRYNPKGHCHRVQYTCMACAKFEYIFLLYFSKEYGEDSKYVMKVGQFPQWDIAIDKKLSKMLGKYEDMYKKGLINESQGYGIGAYSYYRRVVENIIDELLETITDLIGEDQKGKYLEALEKTKKTKIASDKIDKVKDLLPPILRPGNMNPLSILHDTLSMGIHSMSDEECLERAQEIRRILIFLINQILSSKDSANEFTESMKKLLKKKSSKS